MKQKLIIVLRYLIAIAFGFAAGYFVKAELLVPASPNDAEWQTLFMEDADHGRIIAFQNALQKPTNEKTTDELSKQLDAQGKIEDLILKSRQAEYAKWLPFTPLFSGFVGAALGLLAGVFGKSGSQNSDPK